MFVSSRTGEELSVITLQEELNNYELDDVLSSNPLQLLLLFARHTVTNGEFDYVKFMRLARLVRLPRRVANVFLNYLSGEYYFELP